jgi:maleylacetate reductase
MMEENMQTAGSYQYPAMDSVIYGKPAAEALREEAERLGAKRVFLIASRTLNTTTDEIEKIRSALGDRYAGTFDGIPQHTTREVVVQTAARAKEPARTWSSRSAAALWSTRQRSY